MTQQEPTHERLGILIVEDSDLLREIFCRVLRDMHSVYTASGIKEGWRLYREKSPDIVFLDIGLPDGNGHDLACMIKEQNPATYVIMATASHSIENRDEAERNHVDGVIAKPFTKKEINDYVDRYMAVRHRIPCGK